MHLGAILHKLSFVVTKRSYILRGEIFKTNFALLFCKFFSCLQRAYELAIVRPNNLVVNELDNFILSKEVL
jgi:hypothetical protein